MANVNSEIDFTIDTRRVWWGIHAATDEAMIAAKRQIFREVYGGKAENKKEAVRWDGLFVSAVLAI